VRRDGALVAVPAAWRTRAIDLGHGPRSAMTIPWGDLATAYRTTGIPNIEVYMAVPRGAATALRLTRSFVPLLGAPPVQALLKAVLRARAPGPNAAERAAGECRLWAEVTGG